MILEIIVEKDESGYYVGEVQKERKGDRQLFNL